MTSCITDSPSLFFIWDVNNFRCYFEIFEEESFITVYNNKELCITNVGTFYTMLKYLNTAKLLNEELLDKIMLDIADFWNNSKIEQDFHIFMGMIFDEYGYWVETGKMKF
jgi:hypothetical protein